MLAHNACKQCLLAVFASSACLHAILLRLASSIISNVADVLSFQIKEPADYGVKHKPHKERAADIKDVPNIKDMFLRLQQKQSPAPDGQQKQTPAPDSLGMARLEQGAVSAAKRAHRLAEASVSSRASAQVSCPVCGLSCTEDAIEQHVEACLQETAQCKDRTIDINDNDDNSVGDDDDDIVCVDPLAPCPICQATMALSLLPHHVEACLHAQPPTLDPKD